MTPEQVEFLEGLLKKWRHSEESMSFVVYIADKLAEARKPKTRKVKMLAWLSSGGDLYWRTEGHDQRPYAKRVPSEDKEIEIEE